MKGESTLTVSRSELLVDGGDTLFRGLLYDLFAFSSRLDDARSRFARYIGLTPPQYMTLIIVGRDQDGGGISVSQVAAKLHLSGAFVTSEINKLVRLGLVDKRPDPDDRRRVRLTVTAAGISKLSRLAAIQRQVNDALFASLDRDAFLHLARTVNGLAKGADRALLLADHLIASEATG